MNYGKPTSRRGAGHNGGADDPLGVNTEIGRKLRQYYDDLITEEVPDRFASLLSELEQSERSKQDEKED